MWIKGNSIIKRTLVAMITVVIIQAILLICTTFGTGILTSLKNNAFNVLNDKVNEKNMYLQNQMLLDWSNINLETNRINSYILNYLKSNNITTDDLNRDTKISTKVLNDISRKIMTIPRISGVTGAFIIFDTQANAYDNNNNDINNISSEEQTKSVKQEGVYIRDIVPSKVLEDNSDLVMLRGEEEIAQTLNIKKATTWKRSCVFNEEDIDKNTSFFFRSINAAKQNPNKSFNELGYWSKPFSLNGDSTKIITYSVPLIDKDKKAYGVFGIEVTLDYINELLGEDEINNLDSYLIAVDDNNEDMTFSNINSDGSVPDNLNEESLNLKFNIDAIYRDIYEIRPKKEQDDISYGSIKYFNLYEDKSPFKGEKWALVGLIKKKNLLYYINELKFFLIISLVISTVIGVISAFTLGHKLTRPIVSLAKKVRESNPKNTLELDKIDISEIDDLSSAITLLNVKVADSASKLSQIIELLNMPIGAFEYKKEEKDVFITNTFFRTLGINNFDGLEENCIDKDTFELIIKELKSNPEEDLNQIYRIADINDSSRLIELKIFEDDKRILGTIIDVTQNVLEKRKIEYERDHDVLTNLLNRRAFYKIVNEKLQEGNASIGAFIMWDLDNLKYVNDTYGHDDGDKYIKETAVILDEFQKYNAIVARKSGDEFLVFIYGYTSKDEIRDIVSKIHSKMKNTVSVFTGDNKLKIRASAGLTWYPEDTTTYEELSRYSDFAMYKIKHTSKGSISEFNKNEYEEESFLLKNKEELNKLIDEELVQYAFQPIVDCHTGEIYGYEALMRSKLDTIKSPLEIIKLATSESKLYEIEKLTWFKALEAFVEHKEDVENAKLFINSIPNFVLSEEDSNILEEKYGEYLSRLVIEFLENERSVLKCTAKKRKLIEKWNAKLAIDDFGSGYNNEATLLDITPDFVKIDMEIVQGIDKDLNRQQLSSNLISYAKGRNIKIIAEGVETRSELEKLIELGVDYIQGYYLSRPQFTPPKIDERLVQEILDINKKL